MKIDQHKLENNLILAASENTLTPMLGIFGGVGPLASTKFVESIYFLHSHQSKNEQYLPKIVLYSDPSMPDRTTYLNMGLQGILLTRLIDGMKKLLQFGAEHLVICCFTLHHLLPFLPDEVIKNLISLPYVALDTAIRFEKKSLLLCTNATHKLKIFQSQANWDQASDLVVFPNKQDQEKIHDIIYLLKKNSDHEEITYYIKQLLKKYQVNSWIVGCTEFHLLTNSLLIKKSLELTYTIIDPLLVIGEKINQLQNFISPNAHIA